MTLDDAKIVDYAINVVVRTHQSFSGQCAKFACTLNRVLKGEGHYLLVDGDHYEFADHVAVCFGSYIFDGDGLTDRESFETTWCNSDDDDDSEKCTLEDIYDHSLDGNLVTRFADSTCGIFGTLDTNALERELIEVLIRSEYSGDLYDRTSNSYSGCEPA